MAVDTNPLVTGIPNPVRMLYGTGAEVTTAGTSEETAASYTLKGGTLARNGQAIRIKAVFQCAANGNSKAFAIKFGATTIASRTVTTNNSGLWVEASVVRISATAQTAAQWNIPATSPSTALPSSPAETLSGDVVIAVTMTTSSAAGDLTLKSLTVELLP